MNPLILIGATAGAVAGWFLSENQKTEKKELQTETKASNSKKEGESTKRAKSEKTEKIETSQLDD